MKLDNNLKILKNAIKEGIESGTAVNFDSKKHLKLLKANKRISEISPK